VTRDSPGRRRKVLSRCRQRSNWFWE